MINVLIVEDEALLALHTAEILAELGFSATVFAHSMKRAEELIRIITPFFCVLDVNIGREQIFPFARRLADLGIPFLFLTAADLRNFPKDLLSHPILSKPLDPKAAERALKALGVLHARCAMGDM